MTKRVLLLVSALAALVLALPASAETVRLGVVAGVELLNRPTYDDVLKAFDTEADVIPGFSWEVLHGHVGTGLTGLVRFDRLDPDLPGGEYDWYMDWIGSWDLRYHILNRFLLDPFLEAGAGSAGRVRISDSGDGEEPLNLSLFGQVGGGLAVRLGGLHVGAKVLYRIMNAPVPATSFEIYPLKRFHVDIFGGVSL